MMALFKLWAPIVILLKTLPTCALLIRFPYYAESFNPNSSLDDGTSGATGNCWTAASNTNGAAVTLQPCNGVGSASQSWIFTGGEGSAGVVVVFGTMCLDVTNGADASGTKLQIWDCGTGNNPNQLWQAGITGDDSIGLHVQWANHSRCVDLTGGSQAAGTPIQIWTCETNNTNQKWVPEFAWPSTPADDFPLRFHSELQQETARQLSIVAQDEANNAPVTMAFSDIETEGLNWAYNNDGSIQLANAQTFCLEVTNGVNANGTKLQVNTCSSGDKNQQWQLNEDYTIQWSGTNKCIDLTDGKLVTGNQLQIWTCSAGNQNQQWKIDPVE